MTAGQYDALAKLLRLPPGPARDCSRMVLVDGVRIPDAAKALGMQYRAAAAAVQRARAGYDLAEQATGRSRQRAVQDAEHALKSTSQIPF